MRNGEDHYFSEDKKCNFDIDWELNHTLMLIIQKTTGEKTHEILNTVISEFNKMIKEIEFDLSSKKAGATWQRDPYSGWNNKPSRMCWYSSVKRRNRILTYPNTDIKLNLKVTCSYSHYEGHRSIQTTDGTYKSRKVPENTNHVTVVVELPIKKLKFSTTDINDILADGDIFDVSTDVAEPELKQSKPPRKKKTKADTNKEQEIGEETHNE